MSNLINSYSLSSVIGIGTDTPNQNLTVVGGISGNALVYDQTGNSSQWNSVYTSVKANSGSYATSSFVQSNYLNLTGGTVNGNVTFTGNISAQGTAYFANTVFTTSSAISAVVNSSGPALYVSQLGSGDLASFYDFTPTPVEVLHVGASIGIPGVGIYTSNPNKELTVVGEISATKTIYASGGNSNQWNNVYSYVNSTSATNNPTYNATNFSKLSSQAYTLYPSTSTILPTVGNNQSIGSVCSYIGSGQNNIICATNSSTYAPACNYNASIFSGYNNTIFACSQDAGGDTGAYICNTFIGGGICNSAITNTGHDDGHIENSTILNGRCNTICQNSWPDSNPGGILNSTIVGGRLNALSGYCISEGVIGGGYNNKIISSSNSNYILQGVTIAGGCNNTISGCYAGFAIIGGGLNNCNCGSYGVLVGGNTNCITSICGGNVIVGGTYQTICGYNGSSFIGGGYRNTTSGYNGSDTIVGGYQNIISANEGGGFIGGGSTNKICGSACNSVVVGGASNTSSGAYSVVAGGSNNTASEYASNVAGGLGNTASGRYTTVSGGYKNLNNGLYASIGGGCCNTASCFYSTVAGGAQNTASANNSTVAGGVQNTASANNSTVAGGVQNTASGNYSFVAAGSANNTNSQPNTFILGSNITASQPNFTYVNNLSSLGSIYSNGIVVSPYAGMRNRIINGDFYIDQRKSGANSLPASTSNLIDRWKYNVNGTPASKIRVGQNINGVASPAGFTSYYGLSVVATSTPGGGDYVFLSQVIEGPNTIDLNYGTSSAQPATLSFYVRSSRTGNFGGFIRNYGTFNRSYPFLYNIPVTNTWTYITVLVPGDTTGTWTPDTSHGIEIGFEIANGSTYQATAGAWTAGNYTGPSGATTLTTILNSTFYVTGVQFEPGIVATPYERRNYGIEYAMCQRYYEILEVRAGGYNTTGNGLRGSAYFRVQKRPSTLNATVISTDESSNLGSLNVDNSNYRYDSVRYITAVTATGDAYGQWQVSIDSEF